MATSSAMRAGLRIPRKSLRQYAGAAIGHLNSVHGDAIESVAIVVPTYRRQSQLNDLVQSVFGGTVLPREVIIVDNDPEASCQSIWPSHWPVRVISAGYGLNLAAARNLGWRTSRADLCLFIDDDNTVAPDMVAGLLSAARGEAVGLLAPIAYEARSPYPIWCGGIHRSMWTTRTRFLYHGDIEPPSMTSWPTDDMPNALAIPRSVLEVVGGFDERHFPFYYDEADLTARIVALGLHAVVVRDAKVFHNHNQAEDLDAGLVLLRAYELGGRTRVQLLVRARVLFHRLHSRGMQRIAALAIFIPIHAVMLLVACLRTESSGRSRLNVVAAVLQGLRNGYSIAATIK